MSPHQIALVQSSMARLAGRGDLFARNFYRALFELDPPLRVIFRKDMEQQGMQLMQALQLAVDGLSRFDDLVPVLRAVGLRHAAYGVRRYDFDTVALAFECALASQPDAVADELTSQAWLAAYKIFSAEILLGVVEGGAPAKRRFERTPLHT